MKDNNNGNITFYVTLAVFIIISVLGLTYMLQNSSSYDERGTFGDMFGFANALFTGLSVVGLLYTVLLQRKDINMQRQELERQAELTQAQNFENTFFKMMDILYTVIKEVFYHHQTVKYEGKPAISMIHYSISKKAQLKSAEKEKRRINLKQTHFDLTGNEIKAILKEVFDLNKNQLASYYRTIFNIVKMIDSSPFIEKQKFVDILTSQLSRIEIMMLYYYGTLEGQQHNKELIEKFSMLKDIDLESMIFPSFMSFYEPKAYNG